MILAIDDDPFRYQHLVRLLAGRATVTHATCPACVAAHLPNARAVLLDHDLAPSICPCGEMLDSEANTRPFVPAIRALGIPVIVTSASSRENRKALCDALTGHPYTALTAVDTDPELKWLGWLWTRGVL